MAEISRRRLLAGGTALCVGGLAGCVSDDSNGTETGNGNGNGNGSGNGNSDGPNDRDGQSSLTTTVETLGTDCAGDQADTVDVTYGEEAITVTGITPAPTPCHEAVVEESSVGAEEFVLTVDVESDGSDGCADCTGQVSYEVRLESDRATEISEGRVYHVQGGSPGTAVEPVSTDSGEPLAVTGTTVTTQNARCRTNDSEQTTSLARDGDSVTIDGRIHTGDPCRDAVITETQTDSGDLSVSIGARSTLDENEGCQQCLGEVTYSASVSLSDFSALDRVTVDYPNGHETTVVASAIA